MSLALVLIGVVVLLLGLPWLAGAVAFFVWAVTRCCSALWPSRTLRTPLA
jgi:hypothetical protein